MTRLAALANAVRRSCESLLIHKKRLLWVQLDGHDIFENELVAALFARVAQRLAPLATEIERRSPNRVELSLKVEGADGRREEIYLRKSDLAALVAPLPAKYQGMFMGLAIFGAPPVTMPASIPLTRPKPNPSDPPPRR